MRFPAGWQKNDILFFGMDIVPFMDHVPDHLAFKVHVAWRSNHHLVDFGFIGHGRILLLESSCIEIMFPAKSPFVKGSWPLAIDSMPWSLVRRNLKYMATRL